MATLPYTADWSQFTVLMGNGATPEVFSRMCGLMSRGFNQTVATGETNVPYCDDETLPAITMRSATALSAEITGSGTLAVEDVAAWDAAKGVSKNYQVNLELPLAQGGVSWTLPMILTNLNLKGTKGEKVTFDVTLVSSGAIPGYQLASA
jgi:hypothetical protein